MARFTRETLKKIKDTDKVYLSGKMAENTKANGLKGNNMAKEPIEMLRGKKEKENGSTEREFSGSIETVVVLIEHIECRHQ